MRNPERIEEVLALINIIWHKNPDFRFNQLIYILQSKYSQLHSNIRKVKNLEQVGFDLFNLEDDKFLYFLQQEVSNISDKAS